MVIAEASSQLSSTNPPCRINSLTLVAAGGRGSPHCNKEFGGGQTLEGNSLSTAKAII